MPRLFLGLDLPDTLDLELSLMAGGIHGARWLRPEQLHLTLHFLGDVDGGTARRLVAALDSLAAPSFTLKLRGAGVFPPRATPRVLWLGVAEPDPVRLVHQRSARIIDALGIERERRKYVPHLTLARFAKTVHEAEVGAWVLDHALYESAPVPVDFVHLYSSVLSKRGAKYQIEASFPLERPGE